MFKDSLQLVKSLLEIKNVSEQVQRISVMKVAKLVILFWLLIILQVKLNAKARKVVFKTLFIIAGIISVFGALGTTGILVYNCVHYEPIEPPKR